MIELSEIDGLIEKLLDYLESIQNEDGSFDTMYNEPFNEPAKGWSKWQRNSPVDTASVLIPMLHMDSENASQIITRGVKYLQQTGLNKKIWRFGPTDELIVPSDIDSTVQCSYVLTQAKYKVGNKEFLNQFINNQNHYDLYLFPKGITTKISLSTFLKLRTQNRNSSTFKALYIDKDDWDFATTCNCLLYIGKCEENYHVWNEIKKNFDNQTIEMKYYNIFYEVYAYARLGCYGNYRALRPTKEVLESYFVLYDRTFKTSFLDQLLFVNSLLFFDYDFHRYQALIDQCILDIQLEKYKEIAPYYFGNTKLNIEPITKQPRAHFGGSSITTSLYLEFLNLYRKKYYNSYYKMS